MLSRNDFDARVIRSHLDIVRGFQHTTTTPPWTRLPEDREVDFLGMLVRPLVRIAFVETGLERSSRQALRIAARHGERRRAQGFPEDVVLTDLELFGRLLTSYLSKIDESLAGTERHQRLEGILTIACLASLRGYYRSDFERLGEWPGTLDNLGHELHNYLPAH